MEQALTNKSRRCYHRVISGIKRGGKLRFLTLTSSDAAPEDIQRSWRCLYMRLQRRGMLKGYIKVTETSEDGRNHLHVLFRGSYIEHAFIKKIWNEIHHSSIVDIRLVSPRRQPKALASYMAKYMAKEHAGRYSWSWGWVWRGFCKDWLTYKQWWWKYIYQEGANTFKNCILGWDMALSGTINLNFPMMQAFLDRKIWSKERIGACIVPTST